MVFNFYIPTRILFGKGAVKKLHRQRLPGKKALIVISNGKSTRTNGYLDKVEEELKQAGVETFVYDRVSPNPSVENVMEGAKMARGLGCDMVVGLGGGSPLIRPNPLPLWPPMTVNFGTTSMAEPVRA